MSRSTWPWILLTFAVVVAIAWSVARRSGDSDVAAGVDGTGANADRVAATTGTPASAVHEYAEFVDTLGTGPSADSTAIAEGLRRLAGALAALQLGSPELAIDLRVIAEHVLLNATSPATAEAVRTLLVQTAAAIGAQQPNEGAALQRAAEAVTVTAPLTGQQQAVHEFLRQSAQALAALSQDAGPATAPGAGNAPQ